MIKEIFFKRIKTNITKSGFTREKWAKMICDECGIHKETRYGAIIRGRKRRN